MTIGKRLQDIRYDRGLTQNDLAREMGITRVSLGNKERDVFQFTASEIAKACKILEVSADRILGLDDTFDNAKVNLANEAMKLNAELNTKLEVLINLCKRV